VFVVISEESLIKRNDRCQGENTLEGEFLIYLVLITNTLSSYTHPHTTLKLRIFTDVIVVSVEEPLSKLLYFKLGSWGGVVFKAQRY
jgi:hypothetical protein